MAILGFDLPSKSMWLYQTIHLDPSWIHLQYFQYVLMFLSAGWNFHCNILSHSGPHKPDEVDKILRKLFYAFLYKIPPNFCFTLQGLRVGKLTLKLTEMEQLLMLLFCF